MYYSFKSCNYKIVMTKKQCQKNDNILEFYGIG